MSIITQLNQLELPVDAHQRKHIRHSVRRWIHGLQVSGKTVEEICASCTESAKLASLMESYLQVERARHKEAIGLAKSLRFALSPFTALPAELQIHILSFLKPEEQKPAVCHAWRQEFLLQNQIRKIAGIAQNPLDRTHPSFKQAAHMLALLWKEDRPAGEEMLRRLVQALGRLNSSMEQADATSTFLGQVVKIPLENALKVEILEQFYTSEACPPVVRLVFGGFSDPASTYAPFQPFRDLDLSGLPGCEKGVQLDPEVTLNVIPVSAGQARKLNVSEENRFEVNELVAILDYDSEKVGKQKLVFGKILEIIQEGDRISYKCSPKYHHTSWICTQTLSSAYIARIPQSHYQEALVRL